jgi:hypothetical protein
MDYKKQNPVLPIWPASVIYGQRKPMPFCDPNQSQIREIDAPDKSSKFLLICGAMLEEADTSIYYLVEANPNDSMRIAFENGEVSMEDFWSHKGWVIKMEYKLLSDDDLDVCYIHPSQIDGFARQRFSRFQYTCHYDHLIEQCYKGIDIFKNQSMDYSHIVKVLDHVRQIKPLKLRA